MLKLDIFKDNKFKFGKTYFPHYFRKESPPFHLNIIDEAANSLNLAMHAPRGGAKSTVETFLDSVHGICLKRERFIIIVQNTYAKAAGSLNNIKFEFKYNVDLIEDYKVNMDEKDAEGDTIFRHPDGFMTRILCKGADQIGSIRGEKFGAYRPTLIIIDDLEDDEMVKNPDRRLDLKKKFDDVIDYAGEDGETRIIVIGTVLHDDSLLSNLLSPDQYVRFKKIFYDVITDKDESIWPQKWSRERLRELEADKPDSFAKEMRGDPSSGSMETIRREDFRRWATVDGRIVLYNEDGSVNARWLYTDCKAGIGIDLAWENKQVNDFSAIVPGLVTPANDLLLDDYYFKKGMRPDEWEEVVFAMTAKYERLTCKRVPIGIEKAKLEKVMKWFLGEAQRRRNNYLWFKDISWGTKDKIERILLRLGNRYANHSIYHKSGMGVLENQLIRLKSVAHDDIADAAAILPELLAYAPSVKKPDTSEDKFEFLRRHTSIFRSKNKQPYVFGQGSKASVIRSVQGL